MNKPHIVCDTSMLLYLGRIEKSELLPELYQTIFVPEQVVLELDVGRMLRQDTIDPKQVSWTKIVTISYEEICTLPQNNLGDGERAVIIYAWKHKRECIAGIDDLVARSFAKQMDIKVIGLIGILLRAKRSMLISSVRPLLDSAQSEGFRIGEKLYNKALRIANEI